MLSQTGSSVVESEGCRLYWQPQTSISACDAIKIEHRNLFKEGVAAMENNVIWTFDEKEPNLQEKLQQLVRNAFKEREPLWIMPK